MIKNKYLFILLFASAGSSFVCSAADLDGDGADDSVSIKRNIDDVLVNIESSRMRLQKSITRPINSDCGQFVIYPTEKLGQLVIDQSCSSRQGQIYKEIYNWSDHHKSWLLDAIVQGESGDPVSGELPNLQIEIIECCAAIETNSSGRRIKNAQEIEKELNARLMLSSKKLRDKNLLVDELRQWDLYSIVMIANKLTKENLQNSNDLAYYLSENGKSLEACIILDSIVKKYPDRVVAQLNFADALWDLNGGEYRRRSIIHYRMYLEKMKAANKESLIPQRVGVRVATLL